MKHAACATRWKEGLREEYVGFEKANNCLCMADGSRRCQAARVIAEEGKQSLVFVLSQTQWYLDVLPPLMNS